MEFWRMWALSTWVPRSRSAMEKGAWSPQKFFGASGFKESLDFDCRLREKYNSYGFCS